MKRAGERVKKMKGLGGDMAEGRFTWREKCLV